VVSLQNFVHYDMYTELWIFCLLHGCKCWCLVMIRWTFCLTRMVVIKYFWLFQTWRLCYDDGDSMYKFLN
jgi:hypothetical protein